ncbi:hypothetical protein BDW42DRAFT_159156 [Aspergillus taichungensis]|uniref:Uncharacterized protein n=1 Tax=Aspergillus taichungensis TaxID=482145 RepID=A0A2J5I8L0_9EURO|nr:hypothetical protein BDW42DRAFT_159156 [Aspergillus taichungensis]
MRTVVGATHGTSGTPNTTNSVLVTITACSQVYFHPSRSFFQPLFLSHSLFFLRFLSFLSFISLSSHPSFLAIAKNLRSSTDRHPSSESRPPIDLSLTLYVVSHCPLLPSPSIADRVHPQI